MTEIREITAEEKKRIQKRNTEAILANLRECLTEEVLTELINEEKCKVSLLRKAYPDATSTEIKQIIVDTFGGRVTFKRGRNGGVYWSEE